MGNKNSGFKHPVECVETGVKYESVSAACKALGCSFTAMYASLKKGYRCFNLHWKYTDEEAVVCKSAGKLWKGNGVIDLDTKQEWVSITSCASDLNILGCNLRNALKVHYTVCDRYLALKSEYEKYGDELKHFYKTEKPDNVKNRLKEVFCIETNQIYSHISACADAVGVSRQAISSAIQIGWAVKGLHYAHVGDEIDPMKYMPLKRGRNGTKVFDEVNKVLYDSVNACATHYGTNSYSIAKAIEKKQEMSDGGVLCFMDDRLNEIRDALKKLKEL